MLITRRDFVIQGTLAGAAALQPLRLGSASDRIRVGVIGLDRSGAAHLAGYARVRGVQIAALCDLDLGRVRTAAALQAVGAHRPAVYTDFHRLLDDPEIDLVSIATPRADHCRMTIAAAEAGKAVLVEPPCCIDVTESERLAQRLAGCRRPVQQRTSWRFVAGQGQPVALASPFSRVTITRDAQAGEDGITAASIWHCIDDIDFALALMPLTLPGTVSAIALRHRRAGQYRTLAAQFQFGGGPVPRRLEIDVSDRNAHGTTLRFHSAQGVFVVQGEPLTNSGGAWNATTDLLARMRDGRHDLLLAPVAEARQACSIAFLASEAIERGRPLEFPARTSR